MSKLIDNNKVMELFYNNPNTWYHIREISRILELSPSTSSKYLNLFVKESLLEKKEERMHILFRANTNNKNYKTKKINYNIEKIKKSGIIEYLEKEFNYPKAIILFGSYAKGENTKNSDIDIFIQSETIKEPQVKEYEKKLKVEIQLFIYNEKKLKLMKKTNKELFNNIINGIKLQGFIEVL